MRILSIDITGKVSKYDDALFSSLLKCVPSGEEILCMSPYSQFSNILGCKKKLFCLIPQNKAHSEGIIKRAMKALECFLNYIYVLFLVRGCFFNVIHLQWLPFLEISSIEIPILKLIKKISPRTNIVLTIHNIYPHNMNTAKKILYKQRFMEASKYIDRFIVHTCVSKKDVINEFDIKDQTIFVCHHGVFEPEFVPQEKSKKDDKFNILQFGGQSYYKGTDLLVKAVCNLDQNYKSKISVNIVGGINQNFYAELKGIDTDNMINWKPYFLSDTELYNDIHNSDLIVLPYRAISQSGVLLLSIYFNKLIICSDLPSFKETLHGLNDDSLDEHMFFKTEDADSLKRLLIRYISGSINKEALLDRMKLLKDYYSWDNAALNTWKVYKL